MVVALALVVLSDGSFRFVVEGVRTIGLIDMAVGSIDVLFGCAPTELGP